MEKHVVQPLLYHTVHCMTVVGLNPFKQNIISKLLFLYTLLSVIAWVVLTLLKLIYNWKGMESMDDLVFMPACYMSLAKGFCLFINNRKLHKIITSLNEAWPLGKFGMDTEMELSRLHQNVFKLFKFYIMSAYSVCGLMMIPSILSKEPVMLFPIYEVCDFHKLACFYPVYLWEIVALWWSLSVPVLSFEAIFISMSCHAYVGMEMVRIGLKKMLLTDGYRSKKNMRELINHHNFVLSLIEDLNKFFSKFLLLQFWGSLGAMIFAVYMLTAESSIPLVNRVSKYGMLIVFWTTQLTMYCFTGTFVSSQSTTLVNAAYDVNWFSKTDVELRNALSMVIMRSQKAATFSIGGMKDLNLNAFVDVIRNCISVNTLLNTVAENKNID